MEACLRNIIKGPADMQDQFFSEKFMRSDAFLTFGKEGSGCYLVLVIRKSVEMKDDVCFFRQLYN